MPLKTGSWDININGTMGTLAIDSVGSDGSLVGRLSELGRDVSIVGFWDEVAQSISFHLLNTTPGPIIVDATGQPIIDPSTGMPMTMPPQLAEFRSYKGYLFSTPPHPTPGQDIMLTLAGDVRVDAAAPFNGSPINGSSRRNVFGWFAQIEEVI